MFHKIHVKSKYWNHLEIVTRHDTSRAETLWMPWTCFGTRIFGVHHGEGRQLSAVSRLRSSTASPGGKSRGGSRSCAGVFFLGLFVMLRVFRDLRQSWSRSFGWKTKTSTSSMPYYFSRDISPNFKDQENYIGKWVRKTQTTFTHVDLLMLRWCASAQSSECLMIRLMCGILCCVVVSLRSSFWGSGWLCLGGESFSICTRFLLRKLLCFPGSQAFWCWTARCDFETTSSTVLRWLAKCWKKVVEVCCPTWCSNHDN